MCKPCARNEVLRMFPEYTKMAEEEGFEPPIPLRVYMISNHARSTGLCHSSVL